MNNELGKVCYEAYASHREWKAVTGQRLPKWDRTNQSVKDAWNAAAAAVAVHVIKKENGIKNL